jgi:mono/diheme cytochrome c family protein
MSRVLIWLIFLVFVDILFSLQAISKPINPENKKFNFLSLEDEAKLVFAGLGICPQNRNTRRAPISYLEKLNPVPKNEANLKAGEVLYQEKAKPTACRLCHGYRGGGNGQLSMSLNPSPRNFSCTQTMKELSDGQLFWIIKKGSKGTAMPIHEHHLTDKQIWQLIRYIRGFAK